MNLRPLCLVFSNLVLPLVLLLFGCATPPNNTQPEVVEAEDINDPLEDTNRAIWSVKSARVSAIHSTCL